MRWAWPGSVPAQPVTSRTVKDSGRIAILLRPESRVTVDLSVCVCVCVCVLLRTNSAEASTSGGHRPFIVSVTWPAARFAQKIRPPWRLCASCWLKHQKAPPFPPGQWFHRFPLEGRFPSHLPLVLSTIMPFPFIWQLGTCLPAVIRLGATFNFNVFQS